MALHTAASNGNCKKIRKLLRAGANVNRSYAEEGTALFAAIHGENANMMECIDILIEAGADVNIETEHGRTALINAAEGGFVRCMECLLNVGADVNKGRNSNGATALILASCHGHCECVDMLLKAGADVNFKTVNDRTALINVAEGGYVKCMKSLLNAGADMNKGRSSNGATALILASCHGHYKCVDMLLEAGADVNVTDDEGSTALSVRRHHVAEENIVYITKRLLRAGIHINKCRSSGYNALATVIHGTTFTEAPLILYAAGETLDGAHEDDIPKELKFEGEKLELKHICREAIRKHLLELDQHQHLFGRIKKLDLPSVVSEYLLFNVSLGTGGADDNINDAEKDYGCVGDDDDDLSNSDYEEEDDNTDDDSNDNDDGGTGTDEDDSGDGNAEDDVHGDSDDDEDDNDSNDGGHLDDDDETVDDDIFYQIIAQDKECSL